MKRREFFKKALLGLSTLVAAPSVLAEACKVGAAQKVIRSTKMDKIVEIVNSTSLIRKVRQKKKSMVTDVVLC